MTAKTCWRSFSTWDACPPRYVDREIVLRQTEVTRDEIDHVDERTGEFDADNRAGIERTLHRISAIRNRRTHIVGLTLRVGHAVYGTVDIIQDIVETGKSVLILGSRLVPRRGSSSSPPTPSPIS